MIHYDWRTMHIKGHGTTACKNLQTALRAVDADGFTVVRIMPHAESFCVVARRPAAELLQVAPADGPGEARGQAGHGSQPGAEAFTLPGVQVGGD